MINSLLLTGIPQKLRASLLQQEILIMRSTGQTSGVNKQLFTRLLVILQRRLDGLISLMIQMRIHLLFTNSAG